MEYSWRVLTVINVVNDEFWFLKEFANSLSLKFH